MRAGQVVRIRVNPKDCVSVLDVLEKANVSTRGMSFSSIVSLALSAMLQGLRDGGTIEDRSGFEYMEKMEPFLRNGQGNKLKITNNIYGRAASGPVAPGVGVPVVAVDEYHSREDVEKRFSRQGRRNYVEFHSEFDGIDTMPPNRPNEAAAQQAPLSEDDRYARQRLTELVHKRDLVEDNAPGVTWSNHDQEEYEKYYKVVYPND